MLLFCFFNQRPINPLLIPVSWTGDLCFFGAETLEKANKYKNTY